MSTSTRRRRRALSALALGVAPVVLAACGSSGTSADGGSSAKLPKTLVFSPLSLAPPALKGLSEGVKGYAGSKGWKVVVQDPNFDPTKQTQALSTVINSGTAGALWTIAVNPQSMGQTIKAAQAKGIPILVNGTPEEYGYKGAQPGITFDYIDYAAGGKSLGGELGKCINEKLGGKAEVLFAESTPGQAGKAEFEKAAKSALAEAAPNAKIVQELVVKDRTSGQTDIGNALQGHPNLNAIMGTTDEAVLGALGAYGAANKKLPCLTDFGGNDEVLKGVKDGDIYSSVALQFQADMTQSFDTLAKMQADPTSKGQVLVVPQKTITGS